MKSTEQWQNIVKERISELEAEAKRIADEIKQLKSIPGIKAGPSSSKATTSTSKKPRAKRGQRKEEFVKAVSDAGSDGITVAAIAKQTNAQAPGLYPLAKKLVEEGIITKKDNLYFMANGKKPSEENKED